MLGIKAFMMNQYRIQDGIINTPIREDSEGFHNENCIKYNFERVKYSLYNEPVVELVVLLLIHEIGMYMVYC